MFKWFLLKMKHHTWTFDKVIVTPEVKYNYSLMGYHHRETADKLFVKLEHEWALGQILCGYKQTGMI